jgi:hypothetical protein
MGTNSSGFNFTTSAANWSWINTTAANSGTAQSSPVLYLFGKYWNGSASANDYWGWYDQINSGTNGASTLTFAHTGTSGSSRVSVPNLYTPGDVRAGYIYPAGITPGNCLQGGASNEIVSASGPCGTSSGTLTATGSPAVHQVGIFSGGTSLTGIPSVNTGYVLTDNGGSANPTYQAPAGGPPSGTASGDLAGSYPSPTVASHAVTSAKMAVANTYRPCDIAIGDQSSATVLINAQLGPQKRLCFIPAAATIVEIDVNANNGTPNVIVGKNHAGSVSNIVSTALSTAASGGIACTNTGGTTGLDGVTMCSSTLQNTSLAAGDYLELVSGTAGGVAALMAIHVVYAIN